MVFLFNININYIVLSYQNHVKSNFILGVHEQLNPFRSTICWFCAFTHYYFFANRAEGSGGGQPDRPIWRMGTVRKGAGDGSCVPVEEGRRGNSAVPDAGLCHGWWSGDRPHFFGSYLIDLNLHCIFVENTECKILPSGFQNLLPPRRGIKEYLHCTLRWFRGWLFAPLVKCTTTIGKQSRMDGSKETVLAKAHRAFFLPGSTEALKWPWDCMKWPLLGYRRFWNGLWKV